MKSLSLVIFGVTSNLAQIKLIPALYDLVKNDMLPFDVDIIGVARSPKTQKEFDSYIHEVLHMDNRHHKHQIDDEIYDKLCKRMSYVDGDVEDVALYDKLKKKINSNNKMFYLATYPDLYERIFTNLKKSGLTKQTNGFSRLMIEKPLGTDLKSAKRLNKLLLKYFNEDQIYRLDHYLGKETLQNIIDFRFGNGIFEPLINRDYVDHIQITAAEDFGIGKRGGYYDSVGALKDVGQNHLLQMIALATMQDPMHFTNEAITKERVRILQSLKPLPGSVVYGQYDGYKKEENINPKSSTDTFFAFKTEIKNKRFKGVPIYVRAGKMLERTVTEIAIVFKLPINRIFKDMEGGLEQNVLIYRIQPNEGIVLKILARSPGYDKKIVPTYMQFCYRDLPGEPQDAYENLIQNALEGDQTFFNDAPEVEAQWRFTDKLIKAKKKVHIYRVGSWGPKEADRLIKKDGRAWLEPSVQFCRF